MGMDLVEASPAAKEVYEKADSILDFSISEKSFQGPAEDLTTTAVCQPALYVHGYASLMALLEKKPELNLVASAGLSLGEFTAHAASGTFSFEDGLRLVADRGRFMQEACDVTKGSMAAIIGGTDADVKGIADECDLDVANFNAPGQTVVSGTIEGVEKSVALAKEHEGIRMGKVLDVAGAYHSRLMASAQEKLADRLADTRIEKPGFPVYCNVDAIEVSDDNQVKDTLARQVTGSVRWVEVMQKMIQQFPDATFIEFGPKGTLKGLTKRIDSDREIVVVENAETLALA